jgi:multidrug efflux pump subunit AcrA (membrane-fusion protein)
MSKPLFPRVKAASGLSSIPFLAQESLTASDAYQVPEAGIVALEAAFEAAEGKGDVTAIQAQLDTVNGQLATATADLATANTALTAAQGELATAKTDLTAAQADAANWKAKAIEFGAKPADAKTAEIPGAEANADVDEVTAALDALPHNQKADRLLG